MNLLFPFVRRVQQLHRLGLAVGTIAARLGAEEAMVLEAHRVLDLPVNDTDDAPPPAPPAGSGADLDHLPMRNAERIRRARGDA